MKNGFDEILNQWESQKQNGKEKKIDGWLDLYPPGDTDRLEKEIKCGPLALPGKKKKEEQPSQAQLDLHGLTSEEAVRLAREFLKTSSRKGFDKVLIIHGKGYHSPGQKPVLKIEIRRFLESFPLVGRFGTADRFNGGEGATWVILRKKQKGLPFPVNNSSSC